MNTKHIVSLSLGIALLAGLPAGPAQAEDSAEISIRKNGAEHGLSVDLEQLGDGQTLQLSTAAGLPALVRRDGDSLEIEVGGQSFEVKVGHHVQGVWVGDAAADAPVEIIRLAEGESSGERLDKQVKVIRLHREEGSAEFDGEHKVLVMRRSGNGTLDEAEIEIETLIEEARSKAGGGQADGTEISVRRRISHDQG